MNAALASPRIAARTMKTPAHEIVTADMRGLKAALVARAQAERVSVSAVVRWAVESELVRVGMARECSLCSHRDHSGGRAECVRSTRSSQAGAGMERPEGVVRTTSGYAACRKNSTLTASNGNSTSPSGVRLRTPASSNAVTSP